MQTKGVAWPLRTDRLQAHEKSSKGSPSVSEIQSIKPGINAWSSEFIDHQYEAWKTDPHSVDPQWQFFFQGFDLGSSQTDAASRGGVVHAGESAGIAFVEKSGRVNSVVYHYRDVGHMAAKLNPLGRDRPRPETLSLSSFNLSEADLDTEFPTSVKEFSAPIKLRQMIAYLEKIYCGRLRRRIYAYTTPSSAAGCRSASRTPRPSPR